MNSLPKLLIVDDEKNTREALERLLCKEYTPITASNADDAINLISQHQFHVILTDLRLGGNKSGLSVIQTAKHIPSVMMTAFGDIDTAVSAMKCGAFDFVTKPLDIKKLKIVLQQAVKMYNEYNTKTTINAQKIKDISTNNQQDISTDDNFPYPIIASTESPFISVLNNAKKIANTQANVLLFGETGTGKEIIAQSIHFYSQRNHNPFIPVHCAALSSTLLESELFGHEKGAFTGAISQHIGKFECANNGTLFLDEIGEIDASTQVKLLRFLETRSLQRVGSNQTIAINTRIVSATNKNLQQLVDNHQFREDLFYRLNVIELKLPPLRERKCDIPLLFQHYLHKFAQEIHMSTPHMDEHALEKVVNYPWPGNIRELKNTCESIIALLPENNKHITASDLGEKFL